MLDEGKLKNIFYYCLKRTGNRVYAEDLSGDIIFEILAMLDRGYKPENFNAWMWTVARAKYANWVEKKNISDRNVIDYDISDNFYLSSGEDIENSVIQKEEMFLLRRELAIMSREYREITVAYYIGNQKISEIAKAVNLPEGTVKRKLSESRKYLKEGINMVRTYGKRSYLPDNITFTINRSSPKDNVPQSLIESKLAKNILLEAYTNPCSTEELSISLGVASPYLEEEIDKLTEGLLLAKIKDKYETDFVILEREIQKNIFDKTLETADRICEELMYFTGMRSNTLILIDKMDMAYIKENQSILAEKFIGKFADEPPGTKAELTGDQKETVRERYKKRIEQWKDDFKNHTTGGALSSDLSLWFYLFKSIRDMIFTTGTAKGIPTEYPKEYKGKWSITGGESYSGHEILKYSVGIDWDYDERNIHLFKFYFPGFNFSQEKPNLNEMDLFKDILKNGKKFSDLSENEKNMTDGLVKRGLAVIEDNFIKPAFPVFFTAGLAELDSFLLETDFPEDIKDIMAKYSTPGDKIVEECQRVCHKEIFNLYEYNLAQIKIGLPVRLHEQAKFCARDMLHYLHNAVLKYATERNYLPMTDKPVGIGAYIIN